MMAVCAARGPARADRDRAVGHARRPGRPVARRERQLPRRTRPRRRRHRRNRAQAGRQVSLVDVELSQNGRPAVHAAVTLGVPDAGEPHYAQEQALAQLPAEPPAEAHALVADHPMAQIVHVSQGCDLRVDGASAHFLSGRQGEPEVRMWARPWADDEQDPATAALFAIMTGDICAPVTMNRGIFGWAPTVQLTTYLRRRPAPGWLRVMASSTVLGDTWFEETTRCSTPPFGRRAEPSARDDPAVGAFGACAPFR
ncbi:thioesterase family protein [Rhodococcus hoagii]|nr:thioesterase family protein [Prescottella equi]